MFFTLTMVWTVLDDASAEWKDYQREFRSIELELAQVKDVLCTLAGQAGR